MQAVVRFYDGTTLLKAHAFAGWNKEFSSVQGNLDIYAVFE